MPLTYSIATGIGLGLGFITYALVKLISGKVAQALPAVLVLAGLFAVKFAVAGCCRALIGRRRQGQPKIIPPPAFIAPL